MDITTILPSLVMLCCLCLKSVAVNLTVDISPSGVIEEGGAVSLTCSLSEIDITNPVVVAKLKEEKCSLFWSRTYYPGRQSKHEVLQDTNSVYLERKLLPWTSVPYSITVIIPALHEHDIATYSCNYVCDNDIDNVTVDLQEMASPRDIGYNATLLSSVTCLFVILTLLVTVVAVSCHQHKRAIHEQSNLQTRGSQQDLLSVCPHESHCRCSQCVLCDPPPRYSQVAGQGRNSPAASSLNTGKSQPGQAVSPGDQTQQDTHLHNPAAEQTVITLSDELSDACAVVMRRQESFSKPPGYDEALEYLQQSGVVFNPETLSPMPPAYDDAAALDPRRVHAASPPSINIRVSSHQQSVSDHSTET